MSSFVTCSTCIKLDKRSKEKEEVREEVGICHFTIIYAILDKSAIVVTAYISRERSIRYPAYILLEA